MKLTVSLSERGVAFIDRYRAEHGGASRSAVVHRALRRLRYGDLERQYAQLWAEWDEEENAIWDVTLSDGLEDEPDVDWTGVPFR